MNGFAAEFDGIAGAAGGADLADDIKRHVFGGNTGFQTAIHFNQHIFGFFGGDALGGHGVLHFGSADAVRQCAECAVGGGVGVAAHHRHAGQCSPLLGAHHMHNALPFVFKREIGQSTEFFNVVVEGVDLQLGNRVFNALIPMVGGGVVVGGGHHAVDAPKRSAGQFQAFEGLRAGDFVHQMAVDIKQHRAVLFFADDMAAPEFVVKGLCVHSGLLFLSGLDGETKMHIRLFGLCWQSVLRFKINLYLF